MDIKLFIATKAFVLYQGKVLILKEAGSYTDGTNTGKYDLPGGRLKPGEQFNEALKREVFEETGLDIEIGSPISVGEWRPVVRDEQWQVVGIFFKCISDTDVVKLSEDHDSFLWIDPKDYSNYPIIENLKFVFENYLWK